MLEKKIVIMNDKINKKRTCFPIETLEEGLNQCWENGTPSCVSHDYQKPFAWVLGDGLLFEPKYTTLIGTLLIPENERDQVRIYEGTENYIQDKHFSLDEQTKNRLREETKNLITDNAIFCNFGFDGVIDENIVPRLFPYLFTDIDKKKLIKYDQLKMIFPGVFEIGNIIIFAHQYFRRNYSRLNNLNSEFLDLFDNVSKTNNSLKIAIDLDMIGLKDSFLAPMEFEFWWGPKFNDSINDIPKGVTRYHADEKLRFFHQVVETDFFWYEQDNHCILECEEVVDFELKDQPFKYGCRYIHSMVDKNNNDILHLDGAIRGYSDNQMIDRLDIDISKQDRSLGYLKLWRIDGSIPLSTWKELICHFYRDNYLVGEYLSPQLDDNTVEYLENAKQIQKNIIDEDFFDKPKKSGYHAYIAYEKKDMYKQYKDEICILPNVLNLRNKKLYFTESILVEFRKLCGQNSIKLSTPIDHENIAFEDLISNLPQLYFSGKNASMNANKILNIIEKLIIILASNSEERIFSFSLSVEYESKIVIYSFLGNIIDLKNLMPKLRDKIPTTEKELPNFISLIRDNNADYVSCLPLNCIGSNKAIFFNRKLIDNSTYQLKIEDKLVIAQTTHKEIIDYMQKFKLELTPANLIIKSTCSKCKESYKYCKCIKYQGDSIEIINKFEQIGAVLTRHKANNV